MWLSAVMSATACASGGLPVGQGITVGEEASIRWSSEWTDRRIKEEGIRISYRLEIEGQKDRPLHVAVFGKHSNSSGETWIATVAIRPEYDTTTWPEFSMFLPQSRVQTFGELKTYIIPQSRDAYIAIYQHNLQQPGRDAIWSNVSFKDDVPTSDGEGIEITATLDVIGFQGEGLDVYVVLHDYPDARPIGPQSVFQYTLAPPYPHTSWSGLKLRVPYKALEDLPSRAGVWFSLAVRTGGAWHTGNVHLFGWRDGSPARMIRRYEDRIRELDEAIVKTEDPTVRYFEARRKILEGGN